MERKILYRQKKKKVFGEEKYVVNFEPRATISLQQIAEQIAYRTTAQAPEVEAYLEEVMAQAKFTIAEGASVKVKGLGTFYLKMHCDFVEDLEKVSAANIDRLNVGFRASTELSTAMKNAKVERWVPTSSSTSKKKGGEQ